MSAYSRPSEAKIVIVVKLCMGCQAPGACGVDLGLQLVQEPGAGVGVTAFAVNDQRFEGVCAPDGVRLGH